MKFARKIQCLAAASLLLAFEVKAQPYHVKTEADLPAANLSAAANNPFKGFVTSPNWVDPSNQKFPSTLDFYYIGLDTTMTGDNSFDWSYLEGRLNDSASRNRHAVLRFILDYPNDGDSPYVPAFLVDQGLQFDSYSDHGGGQSPDYTDTLLLVALEQFIFALGANYDGDKRIAFIQLGLLGFWGEWHTYPHNDWIPTSTMTSVAEWYKSAFRITQLQGRYPDPMIVNNGFGLKDDSFAYATLNKNNPNSWFFWPRVTRAGYTDFWRHSVMSGEVFPGIQGNVFSSTFPNTATDTEQDFNECTETTHATYIIVNYAFQTGYSGQDLVRAEAAAHRLGYAYRISRVEVTESGNPLVDIRVEVTQDGVAPFYYPLSLHLSCDGIPTMSMNGVQGIIAQGDSQTFDFLSVIATPSCLRAVTLSLSSSHGYSGSSIKFAQGADGGVVLNIPSALTSPPTTTTTMPTAPPPTASPVIDPSPPTTSPVVAPTTCGVADHQGECTTTGQCQGIYADAYDCKNSEGGVCFCGNNKVCGCSHNNNNNSPTPPMPMPSPSSPPAGSCGVQDHQGECTTTGQCQGLYAGAYDCKNSEGGVCFCGNNEVCGCL